MSTFIRSDVVVDPAAVVGDYTPPMADAVIDLNFEAGRFWYNGANYPSIAAIIAAGHGDATGGVQKLSLPALPAAFSIYSSGVCAAPAARFMLTLDDGDDGVVDDNYLCITQTPTGGAVSLMYSGGVDQLGSNIGETSVGAEGADLSVAMRVELNNIAASFNGGAVRTDAAATLPVGLLSMIVGNRRDGLRPWSGTLRRLVLIAVPLSNAQLVELASS